MLLHRGIHSIDFCEYFCFEAQLGAPANGPGPVGSGPWPWAWANGPVPMGTGPGLHVDSIDSISQSIQSIYEGCTLVDCHDPGVY